MHCYFRLLISLLFLSLGAYAQVGDVFLNFKEDSVTIARGSYGHNVLKLTNKSAQDVHGKIELELPSGISLLMPIPEEIELPSGESQTLILRFTTVSSRTRNLNPLVYANFINLNGDVLAGDQCALSLERFSIWQVNAEKSSSLYYGGDQSVKIPLVISNQGNVSNTFEIRQGSNRPIQSSDLPTRIRLKAFQDSTIWVEMKLTNDQSKSDKDFLLDFEAEARGEVQRFTHTLSPVGNRVYQHPSKWLSSSLFLSATASNLGSPYPFLLTQARGRVFLKDRKSFNYYIRNNDRIGGANGLRSTLFNLKYNGNVFGFTLGDLNEPTNLFRIGRGLGASVHLGSHSLGFFVLEDIRIQESGYAVYHEVDLGENWSNRMVYDFGASSSNNSEYQVISSNTTYINPKNDREIALKLGYGTQGFSDLPNQETGYMGRFNAETEVWDGKAFLETEFGSPFYPGIERGTTSLLFNYQKEGESWVYQPMIRYVRNRAEFLTREEFVQSFDFTSALYEMNFKKRKASKNQISYGLGYLYDGRDTLIRQGPRVGLRLKNTDQKGSFDLSLSAGLLSFPFQNKIIQQVVAEGNFKKGIFGSNYRLIYGPYFYRDASIFVSEGIQPASVSAGPYLNYFFFNGKLNIKNSVDLFLSNYDAYNRTVARTMARMNLSNGFQASVQTSYTWSPFFTDFRSSISISKSFLVPVIGVKQYGSIYVKLFKDLDGDKTFGEGDMPISNERIRINKLLLESDKSGDLAYLNVSAGTYYLDLSPLKSIQGWVTTGGALQEVILTGNKDLYVAIPFQRARLITGEIQVLKDEYSRTNYPLAGVRITAMGADSITYTGFTNKEGRFRIQVPQGVYEVNFNQSLFLTQFDVVQGKQPAELKQEEEVEVVFIVKERGRGININRD